MLPIPLSLIIYWLGLLGSTASIVLYDFVSPVPDSVRVYELGTYVRTNHVNNNFIDLTLVHYLAPLSFSSVGSGTAASGGFRPLPVHPPFTFAVDYGIVPERLRSICGQRESGWWHNCIAFGVFSADLTKISDFIPSAVIYTIARK